MAKLQEEARKVLDFLDENLITPSKFMKPEQLNELRQELRVLDGLIDSDLVAILPKVAVVKNFGDIPEIECFAGKLNQVFMNIINNAAQAVITSHENDNEGKVVIKTFREDKFIKISISDNGTGIPEEVKQKIFEPFFTTKKAGEGTGLGLSIVYSIIELHKGNIEVHSELGRGKEFLITLPINQ
jgi:signal transduction histidine kinase